MSINFLLQVTRILHVGNYNEDDIRMIYDQLRTVDNLELKGYYNTCTVLTYDCDLELYIEIIDILLKIFEQKEEYEKCTILYNKKQESLDIINYENKQNYEHSKNV